VLSEGNRLKMLEQFMKPYDYLIAGAGLFGSVFAHEARRAGKRCLVIDRRAHAGGNVYCEDIKGVNVHMYGAHIFHTSDKRVWDYVNRFAEFNNYINAPLAAYGNEIYNLPFNMNTFCRMWGVRTPAEAKAVIGAQIMREAISEPKNLEERALSLAGRDVYEKLIKGYTEKQWGRDCRELPAGIIDRLPLRFTYDNNYFNDRYQGIPIGGYAPLIEKLLENVEVLLNTEYASFIKGHSGVAKKIIFTGMIDEFFNYQLGALEYRGLRFETEMPQTDNYQGNAVVNYTERAVPYTRIIEHKHFQFGNQPATVITREYPMEWRPGEEPYYPINDARNNALYIQYAELASQMPHVVFGGRLGAYKYYDMDETIAAALDLCEGELS
jgi:UDP-galactopyranose mutase